MTQFLFSFETVLGLDVAQDTITFHDLSSGRTETLANQADVLRTNLRAYKDRQLAVCEATGGHEAVLLSILSELGIPVHRADGGKINAFARSLHLAKTDRLDARTLALYGRERGANLTRWAPPSDQQRILTSLVRRRADLVEARKIERTRAKAPTARDIAPSIERLLAFLDQEIEDIEAEIERIIKTTPTLQQRNQVLLGIPGIGARVGAALLALLPELGTLSRRTAAALAGVAPHPNQTGTTRNKARTKGGRRPLKPFLFIAALTAVRGNNPLATFYKHLLDKGKPKRLAIVAVMRKIVVIANARIAQLT
jgi:transposase